MDKETMVILSHLHRLIHLHNLIGYMNTLTYDDAFFMQRRLRKQIESIKDDLDIGKEISVEISKLVYVKFSEKYLRVDE